MRAVQNPTREANSSGAGDFLPDQVNDRTQAKQAHGQQGACVEADGSLLVNVIPKTKMSAQAMIIQAQAETRPENSFSV